MHPITITMLAAAKHEELQRAAARAFPLARPRAAGVPARPRLGDDR